MIVVSIRRRNSKTQQSPVILDLRLKKTRAGKLKSYQAFGKDSVFKMFSVHTKRKSRLFHIRPVWRASSKKLRFRDGLVWTLGPNCINKAAFSNFFGVVWRRPQKHTRTEGRIVYSFIFLLFCSLLQTWNRSVGAIRKSKIRLKWRFCESSEKFCPP